MSAAKHTPGPGLSSAQRLVLKDMQARGVIWLRGHYATSRYALQRKGLISFNDSRGVYEVTEAGRKTLEAIC